MTLREWSGSLSSLPLSEFFLCSNLIDFLCKLLSTCYSYELLLFFSPIFTHMAGSSSVWKALSSTVLQAAFNVDAETEKLFRSKRTGDAVFFPPPN